MEFYFSAASTLDKLDAKQGSIKGVIANLPEKNRKRTAALVIETLKYKSVLSEIISASDLQKTERKKLTSPNLTLLLVHDLLFAKGIQAGDGPIKQAILRHKTRLQAELTKLKVKRGAKALKDLAQETDERATQIPRYIRVNTLCWTTELAIKHFKDAGFAYDGDPLLSPKAFKRDEHIPDLLLFHSSAHFNDDPLLADGKIILQDKASCFPAMVLFPPARKGTHVIDATAAPGNKTTLLSALMQGKGKLHAFERDKRRFRTLQMMLKTARCTNVEAVNEDFLSTDPSDVRFVSVTHILLDPSCSGSGIVNRLDYLLAPEGEEDDGGQDERLQKLAAFQLLIIRHAMKFPRVHKIVYSTCSIHATENEDVVCQALDSQEARDGGFLLASRSDVLPSWPRRGLPEHMPGHESDSESLIRCSPGTDHTNGFFVSCFVRSHPPNADSIVAASGVDETRDGDADAYVSAVNERDRTEERDSRVRVLDNSHNRKRSRDRDSSPSHKHRGYESDGDGASVDGKTESTNKHASTTIVDANHKQTRTKAKKKRKRARTAVEAA